MATFLAVLELSRQGSIYITDSMDIVHTPEREKNEPTQLDTTENLGGNKENELSTA